MTPLISMQNVKRILCIGAHPDDIELGVGGTLLRLIEQHPELEIRWLILCGANPQRVEEAKASVQWYEDRGASIQLDIHGFKDAFLPWHGEQIKEVFETLKQDFSPDLIFTHYEKDRHQDHRLLNEFTWNTWRDHAILEYEILKWDGDLGQPNTYVRLTEEQSHNKANHIYTTFASQQARGWFSQDNILALMRIRGVECQTEFAEGFYSRKTIW